MEVHRLKEFIQIHWVGWSRGADDGANQTYPPQRSPP